MPWPSRKNNLECELINEDTSIFPWISQIRHIVCGRLKYFHWWRWIFLKQLQSVTALISFWNKNNKHYECFGTDRPKTLSRRNIVNWPEVKSCNHIWLRESFNFNLFNFHSFLFFNWNFEMNFSNHFECFSCICFKGFIQLWIEAANRFFQVYMLFVVS